ncbi:conserved protein of unknown function [Burkholderia multivorans]
MAEVKHTPGPWAVPESHGKARVWARHEFLVADCNVSDHLRTVEKKANARLIAAAPDLLDALEEIVNTPHLGGKGGFQKARAAIAKATGNESVLHSIRAREAS